MQCLFCFACSFCVPYAAIFHRSNWHTVQHGKRERNKKHGENLTRNMNIFNVFTWDMEKWVRIQREDGCSFSKRPIRNGSPLQPNITHDMDSFPVDCNWARVCFSWFQEKQARWNWTAILKTHCTCATSPFVCLLMFKICQTVDGHFTHHFN